MHTLKQFGTLVLAACALILLGESTFVVNEWEHAVVSRFGKPVKVVLARFLENSGGKDSKDASAAAIKKSQEQVEAEINADQVSNIEIGPGVHFKMPFIDQVTVFDAKSILYISRPYDIVTQDKKKIEVDNYALWRVVNPLRFWTKVHDKLEASRRLDTFVFSILRDMVTKADLEAIVRSSGREIETAEGKKLPALERGRGEIIQDVTDKCAKPADEIGVEILDVRIRRAELPKENADAVFKRMVAERERDSKRIRAEGKRVKAEIEGEVEKEVKQIRSEAEKNVQETLGQGDAEAARIYADAYNQDKDFYLFTKSLETLEASVAGDTSMVIGIDKGIFKMLKTRE